MHERNPKTSSEVIEHLRVLQGDRQGLFEFLAGYFFCKPALFRDPFVQDYLADIDPDLESDLEKTQWAVVEDKCVFLYSLVEILHNDNNPKTLPPTVRLYDQDQIRRAHLRHPSLRANDGPLKPFGIVVSTGKDMPGMAHRGSLVRIATDGMVVPVRCGISSFRIRDLAYGDRHKGLWVGPSVRREPQEGGVPGRVDLAPEGSPRRIGHIEEFGRPDSRVRLSYEWLGKPNVCVICSRDWCKHQRVKGRDNCTVCGKLECGHLDG